MTRITPLKFRGCCYILVTSTFLLARETKTPTRCAGLAGVLHQSEELGKPTHRIDSNRRLGGSQLVAGAFSQLQAPRRIGSAEDARRIGPWHPHSFM